MRSSVWTRPSWAVLLGFFIVAPTAQALAADGLSLGEFNLSAGLGAGVGYDSNVFYTPSDAAFDAERRGSMTAFVAPRLSLRTEDVRAVDFRLSLQSRWTQFVSDDDRDREQSGLMLGANTSARFNPKGDVSVMPSVAVRRTNDAAYSPSGEPFRNWRTVPGLRLDWHPGGVSERRLGFSGGVWGDVQILRYEQRELLNRTAPGGRAVLRYHLLPKTSVFVDGGVRRTIYNEVEGRTANSDSTGLNARAGFAGVITRPLAVRTVLGYGRMNYDEGPSRGALLAEVGLTAELSSQVELAAGWRRGLGDSSFGNSVRYDAVEARLTLGIEPVEFGLGGGVRFLEFEFDGVPTLDGGLGRSEDTLVHTDATVRVAVTRNLGITADYGLRTSLEDAVVGEGANALVVRPRGFTQHVVTGGLDVRF